MALNNDILYLVTVTGEYMYDAEGLPRLYEVRESENEEEVYVSFDSNGISRTQLYTESDVELLIEKGYWERVYH